MPSQAQWEDVDFTGCRILVEAPHVETGPRYGVEGLGARICLFLGFRGLGFRGLSFMGLGVDDINPALPIVRNMP